MRPVSYFLLAAIAMVSAEVPASKGGTITGKVVVVHDGKAVTRGELVEHVQVYLEEAKPARRPGTGLVRSIVQKDKQFTPQVLVIPVGAKVTFPNKDIEEHSVFSPGIDAKRIGFDLGRYGRSRDGKSRVFYEPGEFDIFCDIHVEMRAKVKVVPSRYFAPVVNGAFELTGLPPGTYKVFAWAPDSVDVPSEPVTIVGDERRSISELHLQVRPAPCTHPRADGSAYTGYEHHPCP